jgi:hypothetical protein
MGDLFLPQTGDAFAEALCFDDGLVKGGMGERRDDGPPFLRRSARAGRAAAAAVGGLPILAVLVYVADEHPAFKAGTRTL